MVIETALTLVTFAGQAAYWALTGLITANHVICQSALSCVSQVASTVFTGISLALQDLAAFLQDISGSLRWTSNAIVDSLHSCLELMGSALLQIKMDVCDALSQAAAVAVLIWQSLTQFLNLLGRSILLLLGLGPKSLQLAYSGTATVLNSLADSITRFLLQASKTPLETVLGVIVVCGSVLLGAKLSWATILPAAFRLFCDAYLRLASFLIWAAMHLIRGAQWTLATLRLIHRGPTRNLDSSGEMDDISDSDSQPEQDLRMEQRRLCFERLLGRRHSGLDPEVDILLDQIERERESRLCVVCQDREKCIMILPCKHLCLCQGCRETLFRLSRTAALCPMCRNPMSRTVKVYV